MPRIDALRKADVGEWLTPNQVAVFLGTNWPSLMKRVRSGEVPAEAVERRGRYTFLATWWVEQELQRRDDAATVERFLEHDRRAP